MKKFLLLMASLSVFMTVACKHAPDDDDPVPVAPAPETPVTLNLTVSNIQFDSSTYVLSAETNAADGTQITLTCNELSQSARVKDGKFSLTYETPFYKGIKGGKSYDIKFSAEGYTEATGSVNYWPKVICNSSTKDEVNVFCGGNDNFVAPEIDLVNYEPASVSITRFFEVYSNYKNDSLANDSTDGWTLDDVKAFLKDKKNATKSVVITSVVTPSNGDSNLNEIISVVYHCKNEVAVGLVNINKHYERYEACLYENVGDYNSETAGGDVSFQWQKMNDDGTTYSDIEGATGKTFSLTKENVDSLLNGYIRVKVTQKFENPSQSPITLFSDGGLYGSPYLVAHTIKDSEVYYNGIIDEGEIFDVQNVRGRVSDEFGDWHDINTDDLYLISELDEEHYYNASESKPFRIQIDTSGFYMDVLDVFATVRQVLKAENIPALKTASSSVEAGLAEFEGVNSDLEISYDGGANFTDFPSDEFTVPTDRTLYVRKRARGTPNSEGYQKESETCKVIVKDENIGKKTSGDGLINGISMPTLTLIKSYSNSKVRITPSLDIRDPETYSYEYDWRFDDKPLSELGGKGISLDVNTDALVIDTSKLGSDTYQIYCSVSITNRSTSYTFVTVSAQIPLVVN